MTAGMTRLLSLLGKITNTSHRQPDAEDAEEALRLFCREHNLLYFPRIHSPHKVSAGRGAYRGKTTTVTIELPSEDGDEGKSATTNIHLSAPSQITGSLQLWAKKAPRWSLRRPLPFGLQADPPLLAARLRTATDVQRHFSTLRRFGEAKLEVGLAKQELTLRVAVKRAMTPKQLEALLNWMCDAADRLEEAGGKR